MITFLVKKASTKEFLLYLILLIYYFLVNYTFNISELKLISNSSILFYFYVKRNSVRKVKVIILIFGVLLSLIQNVGFLLTIDNDFNLTESFLVFVNFLFALVAGTLLFSLVIKIIFKVLNEKLINYRSGKTIVVAKRKSFLFYWSVIFICWLPYFIIGYPGILSSDSIAQISQIMGDVNYNDHNPFFHTILIRPFVDFGVQMLGDANLGVALYILFQMLILSSIFSYAVLFLKRKGCYPVLIKLTLIFYALYPIHALYSITMWSDVLFSGCLLLYVISLSNLISSEQYLLRRNYHSLLFIVATFVMILIRHTGIYILLLTTISLVFYKFKNYKRALYLSMVLIGLFFIIKLPVYKNIGIEKGRSGVAYSIPMQQLARTVKYHKNEISEVDRVALSYFFNDSFEDKYDFRFFRNIFEDLNIEYFSSHKVDFFKLWFRLLLNFPETYIKSFMYSTHGYWYPDVNYAISYKYIHENDYDIKPHYIQVSGKSLSSALIINRIYQIRKVPIVSLFFSIGFAFWVLCFLFVYCIYSKRYKLTLLFIPVFVLWLTALASPVYAEFRYVYGMFTCLPFLGGTVFFCSKVKNVNSD